MVNPIPPSTNRFAAAMHKLSSCVGFTKGYNFALWFIFSGALLGFCLARLMYLDFNGVFCATENPDPRNHAAAGECYWYQSRTVYNVGIKLHLYTIIPAGILACIQFVPVIRHKLILVHRINGYITILITLLGVAGAIMIAPVSFGGGLDIQSSVGVLAIMVVGSLALAYYNVKRLQIEQHRAWMLRAWFYAGCIITVRLIMNVSAIVISNPGKPYFQPKLCRELATLFNSTALIQSYPDCTSLDAWVLVKADLYLESPANQSAALDRTFGMATWVAIAIHAIGIEIYLHLTPAEAHRLRNISYQRQLEAGLKSPGKSGTTADSIGDAERWVPTGEMAAED